MMSDQFRGKVEQYSPKSSPRGARSPVVSRQDSTGTLKTTISLGKNPSIVHSGPFYLMKEPPGESELTGARNLMAYYGLEHSYSKFSGKKLKEQLSSFLPNLPGVIDTPGDQDNSSLRSLIDKPPIGGKELLPLTSLQLSGFRLHPGPLPEQYRYINQAPQKKHHKKNKHKNKNKGETPTGLESTIIDIGGADTHEKKHKKQKRHDEEKEARKKRKKEKKRKKQKHSPEHSGGLTPSQHSNS
ncbi:mediator of RNA polymerase II transcription subunit 19 [Trichogramma pretiosum]|uniref:Mediator of RNA polymerase II transcription subunit 19 n=1 Tax=Trichogramma kaykai TaxID=54128 RepID=A0ABD2XKU7_9HYME|nr:mediator of RNA polymerase II transcription subunit 19 [Trichogramma pretiosum]